MEMVDIGEVPVEHLTCNRGAVKAIYPESDNSYIVILEYENGMFGSYTCNKQGVSKYVGGIVVNVSKPKQYRYKTIEELVRAGFTVEEHNPGLVKVSKDSCATILLRYYMFGMIVPEHVKSYPEYYLNWFCMEMDR